MKTISLVVACYNESANIRAMYERVTKVFDSLNYDYELIYVDNRSTDNSVALYQELAAHDARVKAIRMTRNFGNAQSSYFAGLQHATGDAVVMLDGDIQDPPEVIPSFIAKWEEGFEVVYGVRTKRRERFATIFYNLFYIVFRWLSYLDIPLNAGEFSLLDRKVVNAITSLPEKDILLRGLRAWVGYKQIGVGYERRERERGFATNNFLANIFWAKKAIVNFSYKPLEYISMLAIFSVFATVFASFFYLYLYMTSDAPKGFMTLLMVIFIFNTIQLLTLGVIAEYLIRMFHEVKNRPVYLVDEIIGQQRGVKVPVVHEKTHTTTTVP